jgi:hypothetical protein
MTDRARFMAHQPGFISVSLHRSLGGRRIVNYIHERESSYFRLSASAKAAAKAPCVAGLSRCCFCTWAR